MNNAMPPSGHLNCVICGEDSESNVICKLHKKGFRRLSEHQKRGVMIDWHKRVVEPGRVKNTDLYKCYHCAKLFPHDMIIGDHYPKSRGASPDLKFCVHAGVPSCKSCNSSDNPNRNGTPS